MPPEQSIQVEVFVYGTIAVDTSKREVRSVLQGVERLVRAGRTGYAAGSCEEIALIVGGGVIWSEQSVELWERTIAETGGWWWRRRRRGRSRRRSSSGEGSSRGSWSTTKGGSRSSGGGSSSSLTFLDFFVCRGDIWLER